MLIKLRRIPFNYLNLIKNKRALSTETKFIKDEEYTQQAQYPDILDLSFKARSERKQSEWYDKITNLKTIEEKLIEINIPRYYGYKSVIFNDETLPYECLPLTKHYTRTVFNLTEDLPDSYRKNDAKVESFVKSIKDDVEDAISFSVSCFKYTKNLSPEELDEELGRDIVNNINRVLINALSADCSHLSEVEIDLDPRHEAFWFVGGVDPPERIRNIRDNVKWQKEFANDPINRQVQYLGRPYLAIRHKLPLPSVGSDHSKDSELAEALPLCKFDPRAYRYTYGYRHGTTIPGFWPGSPHEFGLLSFQRRHHLVIRDPRYGIEDTQNAIHAQGIQSSYAWSFAQACYQGFSTFTDMTYPLCVQTVVTNGQNWSFYVYQLNTTLIHSNHVHDNPKVNYCWGTNEMKLYEKVDENGKCIGLNEKVLKNLIHFYVNTPIERNIDMKPYLGEQEQKIADIKDDKRREFLEKIYKNMVSNRPRHRQLPEIYMWERIYKINHKTRQLEPKRRPFELGINPYSRKLSEHQPIYIPRALRPEGPKSKKKWEKNYYP